MDEEHEPTSRNRSKDVDLLHLRDLLDETSKPNVCILQLAALSQAWEALLQRHTLANDQD